VTLPTQRGASTGGHDGGGVLGFVAESLRRLEDTVGRGFAEVNKQLTEMPTHYVPRREVERRFDDLTIDLGAEQAARKADIAELKQAAMAAEQSRVAARRWVIGLAVGTGMSVTGVVSGVVLHFT